MYLELEGQSRQTRVDAVASEFQHGGMHRIRALNSGDGRNDPETFENTQYITVVIA